MKQVMTKGRFPVKIWTHDIDSVTFDQLENMSNLPFIHKHIAVMPDAHLGKGACVGSVIPTYKAIVPASVGVDIGCGMMAVQTNLTSHDVPENVLELLHSRIVRNVPTGNSGYQRSFQDSKFNKYEFTKGRSRDKLWKNIFSTGLDKVISDNKIRERMLENGYSRLGTLGGGNHFIEICLDESDNVWIMLHSGSRNIGNRLGQHFIKEAKKDMERFFINLPDKDLSYLTQGSEVFDSYIEALHYAQEYAYYNRQIMMDQILGVFYHHFTDKKDIVIKDSIVQCHHNYVSLENHFGKNVYVTRKGAVNASLGTMGIIPGSMGAKSFIVCGKGNPDSFNSCSHGAGRRLSRSKAKDLYTLEDLEKRMEGIVCNTRQSVVDEIPDAYKDIDEVMDNQKDLVDVVHTLKQILNVKGD